MKIYFDNTEIDNSYVYQLNLSSKLFDSTFTLGGTLCNQVSLQIDKQAVNTQPNYIYLKDDLGNKLYTLVIDSVDDTNLHYYDYVLTDCMILFNQVYDYSRLNSRTLQSILDAICATYLGTTAPTIPFMGDLVISWNENTTARQLVSYIAEVNGYYAYIDGNNNLKFSTVNNASIYSINIADCADISIGDKFKFDRVVYDYGTATYKWPIDDEYTDVGNNTYYINTSNILLTDTGSYSIADTVKRIYNNINNFEFYNISISRCVLPENVKAGDIITFTSATGDGYKTIAQFDWNYSGNWSGGFSLEVNSEKIEETKIIDTNIEKQVSILVDRELGQITQRVSDAEGDISTLFQDTSSIKTSFVKKDDTNYQNLITNIEFDASGVNITSNSIETNLQLGASGVYINDSDDVTLAKFEKNNATFSDWVLQQSGDVFNIFKLH